jgi:hypothetical protein
VAILISIILAVQIIGVGSKLLVFGLPTAGLAPCFNNAFYGVRRFFFALTDVSRSHPPRRRIIALQR